MAQFIKNLEKKTRKDTGLKFYKVTRTPLLSYGSKMLTLKKRNKKAEYRHKK